MLTTDQTTGQLKATLEFSLPAHEAYLRAHEFARECDHEYIGTEHLLLGLLNGHNTATSVLRLLDVDVFAMEAQVRDGMVRGIPIVTTWKLPWTPIAKEVRDRAFDYANDEGHHVVDCHHILRAMLEGRESPAMLAMKLYHGLTAEAVRDKANHIIAGST